MINLAHYREEIIDLIEYEGNTLEEAINYIYRTYSEAIDENDADECISWLLEEYEEPKELLTEDEKMFIYNVMSMYDKGIVETYSLVKFGNTLELVLLYKDGISDCVSLPLKGTIYGTRAFKKLESRRRYTKEELGLTLW